MIRLSYFLGLLMLCGFNSVYAAEGYRYMHVTIETPWTIFIFLLVIVLFPFILMAILYWHYAFNADDKSQAKQPEDNNKEAEVNKVATSVNQSE